MSQALVSFSFKAQKFPYFHLPLKSLTYVGSSTVFLPDGHFFMLLAVGAVAFGLAFLELLYYSGTVGKRSYRRQTFCQAFKEELKTALGGSRGENSDSAPSPGVSGIILFPGRAAP